MSSKPPIELVESVYDFLLRTGHHDSAKSLLKEAKLDVKKLRASKARDLVQIYAAKTTAKYVPYLLWLFISSGDHQSTKQNTDSLAV